MASVPRWCALIAWAGFLLSVVLLWAPRLLGVLHPWAFAFVAVLAVPLVAGLIGVAASTCRVVRGPHRRAAALWALGCLFPVGLWAALAAYLLRVAATDVATKDVCTDTARSAAASVMEVEATFAYPHRMESERLVMYYDDRVADPRRDLDAMERHVARLEAMTGRPLRAKIHWVRGDLLGRNNLTFGCLSLGSSRSPADWDTADHPDRLSVDRHELAHAVIYQSQPADADPPTLLVEGWADSQAGTTYPKRAAWAKESRDLWRERTGAGPSQSYLRELTGPAWYHHIGGPEYNVGGAFAEFLIEKYGIERFLGLYFACRPGRFEAECEAQLGVEFNALESAFWQEVESLAGEGAPARQG
jgi:hypothetical protein